MSRSTTTAGKDNLIAATPAWQNDISSIDQSQASAVVCVANPSPLLHPELPITACQPAIHPGASGAMTPQGRTQILAPWNLLGKAWPFHADGCQRFGLGRRVSL